MSAARGTVVLLAAALALLGFAAAAQAQTFVVTNLEDTGGTDDGSLRGEVRAANANPGGDTVVFAAGLTGTITFEGPGIIVSDPVDIEGPGPGLVTVRQAVAHRVFSVETPGDEAVTIAGLHLADGVAPGGAVKNPDLGGDVINVNSDLTLANDLITGGQAKTAGGVASTEGALTLVNSTVSGNRAERSGGLLVGGFNEPFRIESSTIVDNEADLFDGGLRGEYEGTIEGSTISHNRVVSDSGGGGALFSVEGITIRNSTIANNLSEGEAGGLELELENEATLSIEGSTIAGNHADEDGGGLAVPEGTGLTLEDTIVAGNTAGGSGPDIEGPNSSLVSAFSLIGDPAGASIVESVPGSDLLGVDPQLGPLADNGGPTQTMALPPSSPAVNKGGGGLTTDQRGSVRPVLYPGVPLGASAGANGNDIGAYELQAPPVPPTPPAAPPPPAPAAASPAPTSPRVRVACPQSAKPGGCRFALQVLSAKPHQHGRKGKRGRPKPPVAESAVARVKLAAGKRALVSLTPKPKFAAKLGAAAILLVREAETVNGTTRVSYRRLQVVR